MKGYRKIEKQIILHSFRFYINVTPTTISTHVNCYQVISMTLHFYENK